MNTLKLMNRLRKSDKICPIHHEAMVYIDGIEIDPICQSCQREQIAIQEAKKNQEIFERIERRRTIEVLDRLSILGDDDLKECSLDNFETSDQETTIAKAKAEAIAQSYLDGEQFNCIFTGKAGTGKSHLAYAILKHVNSHSKPRIACLFISLVDLLAKVRESFSGEDRGISEYQAIELMQKVDLLVIDDLGTESVFGSNAKEASDFVQRVLFPVLNARKCTIITTNLSGKEMSQVYNPKIVSRLMKGVDPEKHLISFRETKDKRRTW